MPGTQYGVLYSYDAGLVRTRVLAALLLGLSLALGSWWLLSHALSEELRARAARRWGAFWRLRVKFLAAILLINLLTSLIVFETLTSLQTRSQTRRIERDSILFSQFSTSQVISDFTNFFYFHYNDRFLPGMRKLIASNENLIALRIVSKRTGAVLFDSEQAEAQPKAAQASASRPDTAGSPRSGAPDNEKADFGQEIDEQLRTRDLAVQTTRRAGQAALLVVNTFRNENQEPVFWVQYLFSFESLARSIAAIREQLLWDLVPSLALGLLIAAFFAQLLISPIRRLVAALGRVSAGDYEASVELRRSDEIGELVSAFNSMTEELRKKKELRKYLSDSTYRMVMKAPDQPPGGRIGGLRTQATVLFSDIRGFVTHCESMEAEEVTSMLNEYFSDMVEVIHKHGGEIDKFIGDALLAVFYASDDARVIGAGEMGGAPSGATTALQSIYCALEMREKLREFNQRRSSAGKATIETGVGITHGEIISGPIGSKDRMDFTVIGDIVNLAARIEKLSKGGKHTKIIFSQHVEERVRGLLDYVPMEPERVKGKEELVLNYELIGIRDLSHLIENLRTDDHALRRRSVELLGHSRNPEALPWVIGMLADGDDGTRLQAVLSVAKLGDPRDDAAFDALIGRFGKEPSDKVLSALITAVGKLTTEARAERSIAVLKPFLDSPNERIVANAVEALGQPRSARCTDLILPKLGSRHNRVKANAAMALFAAGHIEVIDSLKPMLMHSDPLMRSSAAFAIGELTLIADDEQWLARWQARSQQLKLFLAELQECVPMLVACLRDPEAVVRRQAIVALGKIKDKSAVLPIIDLLDPSRETNRELLEDISQALRSIGSHKLVREVIAKLSQ
jgi:class 3 adenylate cyclase